jgi:hypothetical protein
MNIEKFSYNLKPISGQQKRAQEKLPDVQGSRLHGPLAGGPVARAGDVQRVDFDASKRL